MTKITDNFCGYLDVGDDTFAYNVSNHVVTLLPAQIEEAKRYEVLDRIRSRNIDASEYLFGVSDDNCRIAMLRNGKFSGDSFGLNSSIQFGTPIIIKASGNFGDFYNMLTESWDNFHAITFFGGNINALCNPQMAVQRSPLDEYKKMSSSDGAREIKIRPWNDYTRSVDFEIEGEKATLTISVSQTGEANNSENMESYSLGELNSFIRFSFENAQGFDKIAKYYRVVKSLIAILTTQNNISFEVYLSQRIDSTQEKELLRQYKSAHNNAMDRHFALIALQDFYYRYRALDSRYLQMCIDYCNEDITLLPQVQSQHVREERANLLKLASVYSKNELAERLAAIHAFNGNIPAFKRLAIINEKSKDYAMAIDICNQAIGYYTGIDMHNAVAEFQQRKQKLEAKAATMHDIS